MTETPLSSSRRELMKAIGAGATLSALGGTTVAGATPAAENVAATQEQDDDDNDDRNDDSSATVHVVQTLVGPPTNPERPADFFYEPTGFHAQPGDIVKVVFTTPDHNVLSYHPAFGMRRRVPTGVDPISAPVSGWRPSSIPGDQIEPPALAIDEEGDVSLEDGDDDSGDDNGDNDGEDGASGPVPDTFLFTVDTPGVYDFVCSPHEAFGMAMRIVVGDETEAPFETSNPETSPSLAPGRSASRASRSPIPRSSPRTSSSRGQSAGRTSNRRREVAEAVVAAMTVLAVTTMLVVTTTEQVTTTVTMDRVTTITETMGTTTVTTTRATTTGTTTTTTEPSETPRVSAPRSCRRRL